MTTTQYMYDINKFKEKLYLQDPKVTNYL